MIPANAIPAVTLAFKLDRQHDHRHAVSSVRCLKSGVCISTTREGGMFIFRAHRVKYPRPGWKFKPIGGVL